VCISIALYRYVLQSFITDLTTYLINELERRHFVCFLFSFVQNILHTIPSLHSYIYVYLLSHLIHTHSCLFLLIHIGADHFTNHRQCGDASLDSILFKRGSHISSNNSKLNTIKCTSYHISISSGDYMSKYIGYIRIVICSCSCS
jgi:hypothetical protein